MNCYQEDHGHANEHVHELHAGNLVDELLCHFPYAAFSLALGFVILAVLDLLMPAKGASVLQAYHQLFHSFHYLHLIFAVTGTYVTFLRYSTYNRVFGAIVSLVVPAFFCTLSDVALPAVVANILGFSVPVHICFIHLADALNLLPFMIVGLLSGASLYAHSASTLGFVSLASHFIHILIASLAALFYLVAQGCFNWYPVMGLLFIALVVAVVVPCTISDIVVPMLFANRRCEHKE